MFGAGAEQPGLIVRLFVQPYSLCGRRIGCIGITFGIGLQRPCKCIVSRRGDGSRKEVVQPNVLMLLGS